MLQQNKTKFKAKNKFHQKNKGKGNPKQQFQFKKKVTKHQKIDQNVNSLKTKYESYNSQRARTFEDLPLSKDTQSGLKDAGYSQPTEIQKESIVLALRGLDILGNYMVKITRWTFFSVKLN